ncbi:hypothetical protein C7M84_011652 [Penaeus vannamei]|uniref:Pentraxin (PTX) domain-containing protein n=1 Tax=Penaeus vannamei TaxID=6689 RepID=A0A3R7MUK2_PENVA|nr:hypothetical protein C7M84_011652 [Penaeus vannamei]
MTPTNGRLLVIMFVLGLATYLTKAQDPQRSPGSVRLVSFQASEAASTNSSLRLLPDFPEMAAVTLNLWVRFRHFSPALDIIVSYFGFNDDLLHFWHDFVDSELVFRVYGYKVTTPVEIPLYVWNHITITFELVSSKYHVLVNDKEITSNLTIDYENRIGKNLPGGGVLILGQDQDSPGGGFSIPQAFSGDLADFCLLSQYFPLNNLKDFRCYEHTSIEKSLRLDAEEDWSLDGDVKAFLINTSTLDYKFREPYVMLPEQKYFPVNSIQIRGLCSESQLDRQLHIDGTMNLRPVFHGTFYTKVWWDNTSWVMASRLLPNLKATMINNDPEDYPVGLHQWLLSGDNCPAGEVDLLLTVCGEESFPCNDGTCVHMSHRCDLRAHCDDGSDEMKCDKVFVGTDYEKTLPPPPPETEDVLNVTLSVIITAVRTLDLLDQTVTLDVQLISEWEDPRLQYADLQPEQFKNQVQDIDRIWQPRLITTDDTGSLVDLMNRDMFLVVIQESEPLPSDDTRYIKAIVFPGSGNPLLLRQELSITFQCQFDLLWFPFDNQRCSINFRLNDVESKLVRQVTLKGKDETSGQKLTIVFTNLFLYYLANSYLPSFLLVVISYSTFYFRLEDFNERIMVSITAMLVLVALFQQTSSTILKTTYLKLIDVWYMPQHRDQDMSRKYNMMARVGLPIVFFLFLAVYGIIAAVQYFTGY